MESKIYLFKDRPDYIKKISKDEAQSYEIDELVEKKFEGSLPAFIAAFTKRKDMSDRELDEVQQMIDRIRKGGA